MDTSNEAPLNETTATCTTTNSTSNTTSTSTIVSSSGNTTGTTPTNSDQLVMSVKCYVKLLLHCMKYPHATVNGVILAGDASSKGNASGSASGNSKGGKKQKSTGQVKSTTTTTTTTSNSSSSGSSQSSPQANTSGGGSSGEGNRMELVDVVPLFHLGHGLTPMTELALLQVSVIFFLLSRSPPMSYDPTTTTLGHTFKPINLREKRQTLRLVH